MFKIEKAEWQFDSVIDEYCNTNNKNKDELSNEEIDKIWCYAGMHISYFLTWIIKNDFLSDDYDEDQEMLDDIKEDKISGCEFLKFVDYTITREDFKDEIKKFLDDYYDSGKYIDDYFRIVNKESIWCNPFYIDRYYELEKAINQRLLEFKKCCGGDNI
jgi:hypothetical protein